MFRITMLMAIGAAMFAGLTMGSPARADDGLEMAKRNHCTACHRVDRKLIGPAYLEVARKYAGDGQAEARLNSKVKLGGIGVWGQIPMPPNDKVPDEDIKSLVSWILQLKPTAPSAATPAAEAALGAKQKP